MLQLVKIGLLAACCATTAWSQTPAPKSHSLNLRDAVTEALENNPKLQRSREAVQQSSASVSGAWSSFLPNVNATASFDRTKDSVLFNMARMGGDPFALYDLGVTLEQPLLNIQVFGGLSVARSNLEISRVDAEIAERDLTGDVAKSFSRILYAQRRLETLDGLHKIFQESQKTAQNRVRIGRSPKLDVLQVRTQMALLEPRIADAKNEIRTSTANLIGLLGSPDIDRLQVRGRLEAPSPAQFRKRVDLTAANLPQIRRIEFRKENLESQRSATLGAHWPSLSARANWGRVGTTPDDMFEANGTSWSAGVVLRVPLLRPSSVYQRRDFASREAQLRFEETDLRNTLSIAQVVSLENLTLAHSQILSNQAALKLAEESQAEGRRDYRLGSIDLPQLLDIQRNVLESSIALEEAKIRYVESLVEYFKATGLPMDQLVSMLSEGGGA